MKLLLIEHKSSDKVGFKKNTHTGKSGKYLNILGENTGNFENMDILGVIY